MTSRLEFFRQPAWMAQFPFAHTIEMTHRLQDGALEIAAALHNLSAEPMPVAIGFHPYFTLTDSPRDDWTIAIGARTEWVLAPDKIPTGETRADRTALSGAGRGAGCADHDLDHVFGDLIRDASGRAVMSVPGQSQKLEVVFGPNYRAAVVYAPEGPRVHLLRADGRHHRCAQPRAARRSTRSCSTCCPEQTWRESFWVRPSGF